MSISVFLVDEHIVLREGLQLLLAAQPDLQVVGAAADGRDAVRQVEQLHPDVVLMDIALPELNGIEAARLIRAACSATQVVMLSMHHTPEHISGALHAGALGYVLKESAGDELIEAIRRVHAGRRYLSQGVSDTLLDYYLARNGPQDRQDPLVCLSQCERDVLQLVVAGKSPAEMAALLSLSLNTVKTYRSRMMRKLGMNSLPDLVRFAIRRGLIPLE